MARILHLSHNDIKTDARTLKQVKSAIDEGHQVIGVGLKLDKGLKESSFTSLAEIVSLKLWSKQLDFLPRNIFHLLCFLEMLPRMFVRGLRAKPQLIHCSDTLVLPIGAAIKLCTGARLVYDAHELESNRNGISKIASVVTLQAERVLWRFIDALIVVSPSIEEWYKQNIGRKKSVVVLNSPIVKNGSTNSNYLRGKFGIADGQLVFLYLGILARGRGIELVLDAFSDPEVKSSVVFLGYGELQGVVIQNAKNNKNIHFHSGIEHERVVDITRSADVGVCLIQNVSLSDYYCLPNKLFEYAFSGIPVLASNFPDIKDVVTKYKLGKVCDLDKKSVIDTIKLLESCYEYLEPGEDLSDLSWVAQSKKLANLYSEVLGNANQ